VVQAAEVFGDDVAAKMRILYDGTSVKPENAKALMSQAEIDGRWWAARALMRNHLRRL
jgi:triosephosphate isomerase